MNAWKGRVSKNSLVAVHDHLYPDKASKRLRRSQFWKNIWPEIWIFRKNKFFSKKIFKKKKISIIFFSVNAEGFSKKTMRASFVKDPIEQIREDFQPLMSYCARDNILCAEIYFRLWPEFIKRFPHPATLSGMLNMGNVYLPINSYWKMFYEKNVQTCEQKKTAATRKIIESARLVAKRLDDEGEEIG